MFLRLVVCQFSDFDTGTPYRFFQKLSLNKTAIDLCLGVKSIVLVRSRARVTELLPKQVEGYPKSYSLPLGAKVKRNSLSIPRPLAVKWFIKI